MKISETELKATLDAAVEAGILLPQTQADLLDFVREQKQLAGHPTHPVQVDPENFRLVAGFNDIFVSLACGLLFLAIYALLPAGLSALISAALCWGLAEYFTRRQHMALPSILLLLGFVGSIALSAMMVVTFLWDGMADIGRALMPELTILSPKSARDMPLVIAASGLVTAFSALLHWRRFRVPITLAAGVGALCAMGLAVASLISTNSLFLHAVILIGGLGVFALAMVFDQRDLRRQTRNSDIAFWLHLLAAPLIVHTLFSLSGVLRMDAGVLPVAIVLAVYGLLTGVALVIDRRALLVSALAYVLYSLYGLIESGSASHAFGLTALMMGSLLVLLSAAWRALRARLLRGLPASLVARVPDAV